MAKEFKMPEMNFGSVNSYKKQLKKLKLKDTGVAATFIGAIAVLLFVAYYVISRLESDRAHREKWKDYADCGWQ